MVTDVDDGTGPDEDLPEPSKEGVLDVARDAQGKPLTDGADPEAKEAPYSRTGWAPKVGWADPSINQSESLLDHATWLEGRIPDSLYGGEYTTPRCADFVEKWLCSQDLQTGTTTLVSSSLPA